MPPRTPADTTRQGIPVSATGSHPQAGTPGHDPDDDLLTAMYISMWTLASGRSLRRDVPPGQLSARRTRPQPEHAAPAWLSSHGRHGQAGAQRSPGHSSGQDFQDSRDDDPTWPSPVARLTGYRLAGCYCGIMAYPLTTAQEQLGELVAEARDSHRPVTISERGKVVATLISVDDFADLEDRAALAGHFADKAAGRPGVGLDELDTALDQIDAQA
jgi:prevent-host-death family protein